MRKAYEGPKIEFEEYTVYASEYDESFGGDYEDPYSNDEDGDWICTSSANAGS